MAAIEEGSSLAEGERREASMALRNTKELPEELEELSEENEKMECPGADRRHPIKWKRRKKVEGERNYVKKENSRRMALVQLRDQKGEKHWHPREHCHTFTTKENTRINSVRNQTGTGLGSQVLMQLKSLQKQQ